MPGTQAGTAAATRSGDSGGGTVVHTHVGVSACRKCPAKICVPRKRDAQTPQPHAQRNTCTPGNTHLWARGISIHRAIAPITRFHLRRECIKSESGPDRGPKCQQSSNAGGGPQPPLSVQRRMAAIIMRAWALQRGALHRTLVANSCLFVTERRPCPGRNRKTLSVKTQCQSAKIASAKRPNANAQVDQQCVSCYEADGDTGQNLKQDDISTLIDIL